jgi:hypothetical protein
MALEIKPAYGEAQYEKAAAYFDRLLMEEVVGFKSRDRAVVMQLSSTSPKEAAYLYLIPEEGGVPSGGDLWVMVRNIRKAMSKLVKCDGSVEEVERSIATLPHHCESSEPITLFAQVWDGHEEKTDPEFAFVFTGSELVYAGGNKVRFARLEDDLYGLALQGRGSYLIEFRTEDDEDHMDVN